MQEQICEAIRAMKTIEFLYDGGLRTVEPHTCGVTKTGNLVMRAFQTAGFSRAGEIPNWRLFTVGKIKNIKILEQPFAGPRNGYRRADSVMTTIFAEL